MTRRSLLVLLGLGVSTLLGACKGNADDESQKLTPEEQEVKNTNARIIGEAMGFSESRANAAAERMGYAELGELESAERVESLSNTAKVTTVDGVVYYLSFSSKDFLQVVRKDELDGEVVWGIVD